MVSREQEKRYCRELARKYPIGKCCEFCDSIDKLERHHFAGYDLYWIFITVCKDCHEWLDKKPQVKYLLNRNQQYNYKPNELDTFNEVIKLEVELDKNLVSDISDKLAKSVTEANIATEVMFTLTSTLIPIY